MSGDHEWRGAWYGPGTRGRNIAYIHTVVTIVLLFACISLYRSPPLSPPSSAGVETELRMNGEVAIVKDDLAEVEKLRIRIKRKESELEATRRDLRHAERDLKSCRKDKLSSEKKPKTDEFERLRVRDKAMVKLVDRTSKSVARLSKALIDLKYGTNEPYKIKMTVGFPGSMGQPKQDTITIEMAPSKLMPTAVLYFMSQVEAGLWDGCSFIRNAHHVLQASAQSPSREGLHRRFKSLQHQSESIPFQEYSKEYTHKKYRIGLAGRPGGPDFYINTVDNVKNHGPGGQGSYDLPEEADSCLGEVVEGFDVVDRMHTGKAAKHGFESLIEYIEIVKMEILQ